MILTNEGEGSNKTDEIAKEGSDQKSQHVSQGFNYKQLFKIIPAKVSSNPTTRVYSSLF